MSRTKAEEATKELSRLEQLAELESQAEEAQKQVDPVYTREQLIEMERARFDKYVDTVVADLTNWKDVVLTLEAPIFRTAPDGSGRIGTVFKLRCRLPSIKESQQIDQLQALAFIGVPNLNVVSGDAYRFARAVATLELLAVPNDNGKYDDWVQTQVDNKGNLRPNFSDETPAAYRSVIMELYGQLEVFINRFLG